MHPTTHDRASVLGESITAPCRAIQASAIVMGSVERQECFKELPNGPKELGESLCRNGQSVQWRQTALGCTESLPRVDSHRAYQYTTSGKITLRLWCVSVGSHVKTESGRECVIDTEVKGEADRPLLEIVDLQFLPRPVEESRRGKNAGG